MTGGSDIRERIGAVFFAVVMVTSAMAVGIGGLAGTAAADDTTNPAIVSAVGDATNDDIYVAFDEAVYGDNNAETELAPGDFTFEDTDGNTIAPESVNNVGGGVNPGSAVYKLSFGGGEVVVGDLSTGGTDGTIDLNNQVFDASGNALSTSDDIVSTTSPSQTPPEVVAVEAEPGSETVAVSFNQPVRSDGGNALEAADLSLTDNNGGGATSITSLTGSSSGDVVYSINDLDSSITTGDIGQDTIGAVAGGDNTDPGVESDVDTGVDSTGSTVTVQDTSVPELSSAETVNSQPLEDGNIEIKLTLSEDIDDSDSDLTSSGISSVGTIEGVNTGDTADDNIIFVDISDRDTSQKPSVNLNADSIEDLSGNSLGNAGATISNPTDSAAPVMTSAQTSRLDNNGDVDQITVTLSENLADGSNTDASSLATDVFTLSTGSITGYGDNDATDGDVTLNVANLQGSSATPSVTLNSGSLDVQDGNGNTLSNDQTIDSTNGVTATLAGDGNGDIKTEIGGEANQAILAGQTTQELSLIRIRDISGGQSPLAQRTLLSMPDGITINESETDLLVTTTSGNLDVANTAIENDGQRLRIEHTQSSDGGQTLRISGLVVDAAPDFAAAQAADASTSDITVDYAIGDLGTALLSGEKPKNAVPDGAGSVGAGTSGVTFTSDIDVTAPASFDNAIGNQTNIIVQANASQGVTFNSNTNVESIPFSEPTDGAVDMSEASISETELIIPVTSNFTAGETLTIDANDGSNGLLLDVAGDAEKFKLDVQTQPATDANGQTTADHVDAATTITRPTLDLDDNNAGGNVQSFSVGVEDQRYTKSNEQIAITTTAPGQIADGSTVSLTINRSDVSFNSDQSIQAPDGGDAGEEKNNDDSTIDVYVNTGGSQPNSEVVSNPQVSEDAITFEVDTGNQNDVGDNVKIIVNDPQFSLSSSVPDEAKFSLNVTTRPRTNVEVLSQETDDDFFTAERPNVEFNANNNVSVQADNDGITDLRVKPNGATEDLGDSDDNALVITSDAIGSQIPAQSTVTVSVPRDSGVTFDQSKSLEKETPDSDDADGPDTGEIDIRSTTSNDIAGDSSLTYSENEIKISIANNGGLASGESITIDELYFNATANTRNVSLDVTTNPGSEVTTSDDNLLKFSPADPVDVRGDARLDTDPGDANDGPNRDASAGGDYGPTGSGEATALQTDGDSKATGETFTSSVYVDNGDGFGNSPVSGAFGEADVDLEIVKTPDGATGQSLNTTNLETNNRGFADFEFTIGNAVGEYVVNASTSAGGVNLTYEATAGQASQLNVTKVKDGLATGSDGNFADGADSDTAVFRVQVEDSGGNIAPTNLDLGEVFTAGDAQVVKYVEDYSVSDGSSSNTAAGLTPEDGFDNGDGDSRTNYNSGNDDNGQAGVFFVYVADQTAETVEFELSPESGGISSDSATATFFRVDEVDVTLNQSSVVVDDVVNATATALDDGESVTVPRVTASYSTSNSSVASFSGNSEVQTNASGVALAQLTADQVGNSTIETIISNRQGSATLTVGEQTEPAPTPVSLANVALDPASVSANTTNDHDLTFDAVNVSDDGNTDSFTVTIPSAATLESANSVSVVDANGTDVSLSGGPDVSGNEITFDVAPDSSADTRTLSVTANVTVAAPDVENETTADITVDVSDSNNGQDSADVTLTVAPADADPEDPVDRFDTNGEPGIQSGEVLNAISAFNEDTRIGGEPVESGDVLDVISAFNEA